MSGKKQKVFIVLGPTASGKESASFEICKRIDAEIISVDSMKVYKKLDIGTAKATWQMQEEVRHHCLDIIEPSFADFSVGAYVMEADKAIDDVASRGKIPLLSGGTALYYKGLLEGIFEAPPKDLQLREELKKFAGENGNQALYKRLVKLDPLSAKKYHPNDIRRVVRALEVIELTGESLSSRQKEWSGFHSDQEYFTGEMRYDFTMVWLDWSRQVLYNRIEQRVDLMLEKGLIAEAEYVYANRDIFARTPLQAVGYKEFFPYFSGQISLDEAVKTLKKNTRHLAKSQMTWFRKFPCEKIPLDPEMTQEDIVQTILEIISFEKK